VRNSFLLQGLLGFAIVFPTNLFAAETNPTSASLPVFTNVTPAQLDAFVAKWDPVMKEKGLIFALDAMTAAETNTTQLLTKVLGALERAPQAFWVYSLKVLALPKPNGGLTPVELLGVWKQACVGLEKAAKAAPEDEELRQMLEVARQSFGAACVEAGRNLDEAEAITRQMLASTPTTNWNYGNVVYDAHSVLGRIALRHGDRETARKELRAAGRTPGSPQLNSFGPQFTLARELLQHGEQADREDVAVFLDDVARFWANSDTAPAYARKDTLKKQQQIETWKGEVRAGKIPVDKSHWP
jgi:hypothetical protein